MLKAFVGNYPYPQSVENFELQANALKMFDGRVFASKLTMPTLIISGSEDILTSPNPMRKLAKVLSHATYIEQEGGAHCSNIETPEWLAPVIIQFLHEIKAI